MGRQTARKHEEEVQIQPCLALNHLLPSFPSEEGGYYLPQS